MPKDNVNKIEVNNKIIDIVEHILYFNEGNQKEQGLKILTPGQMLSRLPISLAQLNAGDNSEKLKKDIRQLLYSLYRSKKLTKQIYKSLINIIYSIETIFMNTENSKTSEHQNDEFDLPNNSYSISDIQDYFEFIIKNTKLWLKIHQFKFM